MLKVLHLSDTPLSGSPVRISKLLSNHSKKVVSRHIVYTPIVRGRDFETDLIGETMTKEEIDDWLGWADIIHFHNRYKRQKVFTEKEATLPTKPGVIHIHSPRNSEDFSEEISSGLPIAIVGQYHPREWQNEMSFVLPNVVDVFSEEMTPRVVDGKPFYLSPGKARTTPVLSYAPSNTSEKGWDNKGYDLVMPFIKRMKQVGRIQMQFITQTPHAQTIALKKGADVGIDEIATGSYHLSSLEYLSLGIPCICNLDGHTRKVVRDITGADKLPWTFASRDNFAVVVDSITKNNEWLYAGEQARLWMERYWNPDALLEHYHQLYENL
jgi:hypothetical protein